MAARNIRNKVQIIDCPRNQPLKSYLDLTKSEVDRMNSALEEAANYGQPGFQDGNIYNQEYPESCRDLETKKNNKEINDCKLKAVEAPKILRQSSSFRFDQDEESEMESPSSSGSSKSNHSDLYTLTLNRANRHRLETALKLLEFVEGGGDSDSDGDGSLGSSLSSLYKNKARANNTTSTPRLQALKERSPKG